ncbi:MAG TPA: hypothetical protein VMH61_08895 [Candidatus Acidoferrales bacterium]|nr:hypothetical protein [Candidatus Acidoferrales bacterium]
MPRAERPCGDTRRDPLWLVVLAVLLLAARVGVTLYEDQHPPVAPALTAPMLPLP